MLAGVSAADGWDPATVGHATRHLHVVGPADAADIGVGQDEVLQVQPDLTDVVVHGLDHQAAHGGERGRAGKDRPVLRGLRVTLTGEGAASTKPSSTGASGLSTSPPALPRSVADSLRT